MEIRVAAGLDARIETNGPAVSVSLSGELDGVSAEPLGIVLGRRQATELLIDLSDVIFVDLAGARALVSTKASLERRGYTVRLRGTGNKVRKAFEAAGLADHLSD